MSEFSESFHLRSDDAQEGIKLLQRAGFQGVVFDSSNHWVTIIPQASLHEAVETFVENNKGILLHYMFAEDYGWEFSVYKLREQIFHYECAWEEEILFDDTHAQMSVLQELLDDHAHIAQFEAILHPKTGRDVQHINHTFAKLLGLSHYEWLSGEYPDALNEGKTGIAYNNSSPQDQRQRTTAWFEEMIPTWVTLRSQANAFLNAQEYAEALKVSQQAIEVAEQTMQDDPHRDVSLVQLFMDRFRIYLAEERYPEALAIFDEVMGRFNTPPAYSWLSWMVAEKMKIHLAQGHEEHAAPWIERVIEYVENTRGPGRKPYHTLLELAQLYASKARLREAEQLYDKAHEILYDEAMALSKQSPLFVPPKMVEWFRRIMAFYERVPNAEKAQSVEKHIEEIQGKHKRRRRRRRK